MNNYFRNLREKFPLTEQKWEEYTSCFHRLDVPAKTVLLNEGEISRKVFLVEKGCIRAWFNNNGKDITFQFFFENEVVASVESFKKSLPSPVSLECLEPGVLWWAHKKDVDRIIEEIKEIPLLREKFINQVFDRTFLYMEHFFSTIRDSPRERYLRLIRDKPQLVKRIPQHFIASYLGISTVHLSRIKSKLAKEKT